MAGMPPFRRSSASRQIAEFRVKMSTIRALSAAALVVGLSACSSDEPPSVSSTPYCPRPSLVADLQSTRHTAEDGREAWTARLGGIAANCEPREFDYLVDMDVTIDLETGPAFDRAPVQLTYFVAVATDTGEVVDKQIFPVVMQPGRNERRALRRETLRQRLPVSYQDQPAIWSVLVGFEPTAQQVRDRIEPLPAIDSDAAGSGQ
jgi:hypothetical protein